jgi:hypothetical protein
MADDEEPEVKGASDDEAPDAEEASEAKKRETKEPVAKKRTKSSKSKKSSFDPREIFSTYIGNPLRKALGSKNEPKKGELVSSNATLYAIGFLVGCCAVMWILQLLEVAYGPATTSMTPMAYFIIFICLGAAGLIGWIGTFWIRRNDIVPGTHPNLVRDKLEAIKKEADRVQRLREHVYTTVALCGLTEALLYGFYWSHYHNVTPNDMVDPIVALLAFIRWTVIAGIGVAYWPLMLVVFLVATGERRISHKRAPKPGEGQSDDEPDEP